MYIVSPLPHLRGYGGTGGNLVCKLSTSIVKYLVSLTYLAEKDNAAYLLLL